MGTEVIICCIYSALEDLSRCDEISEHLILQGGGDSAPGEEVRVVTDLYCPLEHTLSERF